VELDKGLVVVDNGGQYTKVKTKDVLDVFPSSKGVLSNQLNLTRSLGKHDYIVEFEGRKYACSDFSDEADYQLKMFTTSKQHTFFDLSILIACHQYGYDENYVVTCVPVHNFNQDEVMGIKQRLIGEKEIVVNGLRKVVKIKDVVVSAEGTCGFFIHPFKGKVRWVDIGSRTINYITTINKEGKSYFLNKESGTFEKAGFDAKNIQSTNDAENLAEYIAGTLLSMWNENDVVVLLGGGANSIGFYSKFKQFFKNTSVINNPQTSNVEGMYLFGKKVFSHD
jgi:hypothetical protein